ncbi:MAG TPA: hypothetical protein HA272_08605 [Methanoregula sp.]|nr:hypothetical protein [Methanoregula sp.]
MKNNNMPRSTGEKMSMEIDRKLLWRGKFIIPALVAGYAFLTGNATVFPTALVLTLLGITLTADTLAQETGLNGTAPLGTAGRTALIVFSVLIAFSSLFASVFLADFAITGITGRPDGEFVRDVVATLHGFCYMTGLFLLICIGSMGYARWMQPGMRNAGDATASPTCHGRGE